MAGMIDKNSQINAEPTKAFFIDMLTRDIPLDQAILDLVDNSVDGATAMKNDGLVESFEGLKVNIKFDKDHFAITDNCGGFDRHAAINYAFRFGRPKDSSHTKHSIGQFGVGMKRALFKFGRKFRVASATDAEEWAVDLDVPDWEANTDGWGFPFTDFPDGIDVSKAEPGTDILVTELRSEVSMRFSMQSFEKTFISLIKSKHRQFISDGLAISVNGRHVDASNLLLLTDPKLQSGVDNLTFKDGDSEEVKIKIVVGVGYSHPDNAGWYIVCNGRVILDADRTNLTGWRAVEEATNRILIPNYHNQFARFRGIAFFDSDDSSQVPWNTTKTSIDRDNKCWQYAYERMLEMMRPVIDFLNELDADIDDHSKEKSPLHRFVTKTSYVKPETLSETKPFSAPSRESVFKGPKLTKIQYSRPAEDIEFLRDEFGLNSARAVGEFSFDEILKKHS